MCPRRGTRGSSRPSRKLKAARSCADALVAAGEPLDLVIANAGAFSVPASKLDRLPDLYQFNHDSKKFDVFDSEQNSEYSRPPAFESGAGGLVSTVDDYYAFCRMMLNNGVRGRERLLAQVSVESMTSDQLTPQQRKGAEIFFGSHSSWGFGMSVNIQRDEPWM